MINLTQYDCAATYLNRIYTYEQPMVETKKERKVECVHSVQTGRRFNQNAANKANHNHIDICI